jgi:predicted dehydrogenase
MAAGTLALTGAPLAEARGSDAIRVGVVGCGGRGSGAASDCVKSSRGVEIVALADPFGDQLTRLKQQYSVPNNRCFTGLDSYKKLMALDDINLVIIASPPGFKPPQFTEAVNRGKNIFIEKPVATCPTGIKVMLEASEKAVEKGLAVVAGTQRRHESKYVETMKRIHDGAIGKIVSAQCYWNMGALWVERAKTNWDNYKSGRYSDVEWQIRNWLFTGWLSGDHIVEQHVHNIDVVNWAFQALPEQVHGIGGRQYRTEPQYGNIFDHFGVEFFYPGDVRTISTCRQIHNTSGNVSERLVGTKGVALPHLGKIEGQNAWEYDGPNPNPYVQEHTDLINSIRSGNPLSEGKTVTESTLCAIMGRESAYSRQQFNASWFMSRCTLDNLPPDDMKLSDSRPLEPFAIPGQYQMPGWVQPQRRRRRA